MKEEMISRAIGEIDVSYILASEAPLPKQKRTFFLPRPGVIAACMVMVLLCSILLIPLSHSPEPQRWDRYPDVWGMPVSDGSSEVVLASVYRQRIVNGEYADYLGGAVIDESLVGEPLGEVEVMAWWQNRIAADQEETPKHLSAQLYRILGVDPQLAICLRYTEQDDNLTLTHYYAFCHGAPKVSDLSELWTMSGGNVQVEGAVCRYRLLEEGLTMARTRLTEAQKTELSNALQSLRGTLVTAPTSELLADCTEQAVMIVSLPQMGVANGRIHLTQNGYLLCRFTDRWQVYRLTEQDHSTLWTLLREYTAQTSFGEVLLPE